MPIMLSGAKNMLSGVDEFGFLGRWGSGGMYVGMIGGAASCVRKIIEY